MKEKLFMEFYGTLNAQDRISVAYDWIDSKFEKKVLSQIIEKKEKDFYDEISIFYKYVINSDLFHNHIFNYSYYNEDIPENANIFGDKGISGIITEIHYEDLNNPTYFGYYLTCKSLVSIKDFIIEQMENGIFPIRNKQKEFIINKNKKNSKIFNKRFVRCYECVYNPKNILCYN